MKKQAVKKTISIQPDVWEYVAREAGTNLSAFINHALRDHRKRSLKKDLVQGYKAMAADRKLAEETRLWDTTLLDGLDEEDLSR